MTRFARLAGRLRLALHGARYAPSFKALLLARVMRLPLGLILAATLGASGCATTSMLEPTREEVLQRILPSSVQVIIEHQEGRRFRSGSGVVIAARPAVQGTDCFVLTSGHTFAGTAGQKEAFVLFGRHEGAGAKVPAAVVALGATDNDLDLALLRARTHQCSPARPARPPALGESIWVVAFPWGRQMTLARGVVSQINLGPPADREMGSRLMVDASVSYGASGGGIFEERSGGLIGLVEGYRTARVAAKGSASGWYIEVPIPGQTFVIPLADIWRFLKETGHASLLEESPALARPHNGPVVIPVTHSGQ